MSANRTYTAPGGSRWPLRQDAIVNLLEEVQAIARKRDAISKTIADVNRVLDECQRSLNGLGAVANGHAEPKPVVLNLGDYMVAALGEHGPMCARAIARRVRAAGYRGRKIGGNTVSSVRTRLKRDDRFHPIARGLWGLRQA